MATPLHPSLPPKPLASYSEPQHAYDAEQPQASSSTSPKPLCAMCDHQYAKYTCPGCAMRTCSAGCSSLHKSKTGCLGQRNKVAYVPMNKYSWGTMVDDYVYLEEMSRRVGDWGQEIVRGGYSSAPANGRGRGDARGRGRGMRGRGRGGGGGGGGPAKTKRDILKMQLEVRDIDVDLLPVGMERRKLNQSTWDFKNQTALLTIEFKFYKPKDALAPSPQPRDPPFTLLTHRNDMKKTLLALVRSHIGEGGKFKKESTFPQWVKQLVYPDVDDPDSFTKPQCVMATRIDPITSKRLVSPTKRVYYSFDSTQTLTVLLRHTEFVEFPTIEIWDEFHGTIMDTQGIITQQEQRPPKRRKMNPKAGKLAIAGLLGGYGSSEEEEEEQPQNALASLGDYAGSDVDDAEASPINEGLDKGWEDVDFDALSDDDVEPEVDPATLLDLVREVQGGEPWSVEEDEAVDWGYMDDEAPE